MTINELRQMLDSHDPASDAAPMLRAMLAKPRASAKPKIPVQLEDTAALNDTAVRAYFKGRDLYDSALFHAEHGAAEHRESFEALGQAVLREGNTAALKAGYWALVDRARVTGEARQQAALPPLDETEWYHAWTDDGNGGTRITRERREAY